LLVTMCESIAYNKSNQTRTKTHWLTFVPQAL
jgi:hypothetical protein